MRKVSWTATFAVVLMLGLTGCAGVGGFDDETAKRLTERLGSGEASEVAEALLLHPEDPSLAELATALAATEVVFRTETFEVDGFQATVLADVGEASASYRVYLHWSDGAWRVVDTVDLGAQVPDGDTSEEGQ